MSAQKFFIVCQPGFEEELERELHEFWPFLIDADARPNASPPQAIEHTVGGISLEAPLLLGLQINFFSRLASRVLLRLVEFRVRDFPKMHERLSKLDLAPYFAKSPFRVEVAAAKSRLNNEKRIQQICEDIWPALQQESGLSLLIRMYDDTCTVSVDTSGAHLHLRNQRNAEGPKWVGEAPLRETAAAFMLRRLSDSLSSAELKKITLWDPMAGSGTLLQEAKNFLVPEFSRAFAFQEFPACPKLLKSPTLSANYIRFPTCFASLWASDKEKKMVEVMKHNLAGTEEFKIFEADFFKAPEVVAGNSIPEKLWFVLNPPYGDRLPMQKSYFELGQQLAKFNPQRIGILTPRGFSEKIDEGLQSGRSGAFQLRDRHFFKNGGIPVEFSVFIRQ